MFSEPFRLVANRNKRERIFTAWFFVVAVPLLYVSLTTYGELGKNSTEGGAFPNVAMRFSFWKSVCLGTYKKQSQRAAAKHEIWIIVVEICGSHCTGRNNKFSVKQESGRCIFSLLRISSFCEKYGEVAGETDWEVLTFLGKIYHVFW